MICLKSMPLRPIDTLRPARIILAHPLLTFSLPPIAKNVPTPVGNDDHAADIGEVHVVLPRRKAGELDAPEREAVVVTPEILSSLFHHPLAVASQKLVSCPHSTRLADHSNAIGPPCSSPIRTREPGI